MVAHEPRPAYVMYDVSSDRRRELLRNILKLHGGPVQQSTWLLDLRRGPSLASLSRGLDHLLETGDRMLLLRQCPPCRASRTESPAQMHAAHQAGRAIHW